MTQPRFTNPVEGPRIVPQGEERQPSDRLPNGRLAFRVSAGGSFAEHAASSRTGGLDIGNLDPRGGDSVLAMAPGTVTFVEPTKEGIVRIDHGDGWSSGYAHMDGITVAKGQNVARDQLLGKVGKRGAAQVHLHFDISRHSVRTDPWPLLEQNQVSDDFEPLGTLVVKAGTNLRKEPTTAAREHFIAEDRRFDLLGVKTDGGAWSAGGLSGTSWYRIRGEADWWVYTGGAKDVALTKWGTAVVPPQPPPDCSALENRINRALTALGGFANPHAAEASAVAAAISSLKEN